jgi:hypothetical protein
MARLENCKIFNTEDTEEHRVNLNQYRKYYFVDLCVPLCPLCFMLLLFAPDAR